MEAKQSFTTNRHCRNCQTMSAPHTGFTQRIAIGGKPLNGVAVKYVKCDNCAYIDPIEIHAEVDAGSVPEGGIFNYVTVPLTDEGWASPKMTGSLEAYFHEGPIEEYPYDEND